MVVPIMNKRTKTVFGVLVALNKISLGYFSGEDEDILKSFQEVK